MKSSFFICVVFVCSSLALHGQHYLVGESYFAPNDYVEYIHGNMPIILSAPHGGEMKPNQIPDRNCSGCVYINDSYTQELAREVTASIHRRTGCYPHVIMNRLHRSKLDANRSITTGADGHPLGEEAWTAYHSFIDSSSLYVDNQFQRGLFIDLHGHGHDIQRLELGYLISKDELNLQDSELDNDEFISKSSIRNVTLESEYSFSKLLRGAYAFGTILVDKGYPSVPSDEDEYPDSSDSYFSGGYNTQQYGSRSSGTIDAIQIECNQDVRFDEDERKVFADSLASAILEYLEIHYFEESLNICNLSSIVQENKFEQVSVFPNPTNSSVTISSNKVQIDIYIRSIIGDIIHYERIENSSKTIDVSNLDIGIYVISIKFKGKQISQRKLVKL